MTSELCYQGGAEGISLVSLSRVFMSFSQLVKVFGGSSSNIHKFGVRVSTQAKTLLILHAEL